MSEGLKIALTAVTGVAVFVLGQIIQKLLIEPIQKQKEAIGEVLYVIDYYISLNMGLDHETRVEARKWITRATSNLYRSTETIPAYGLVSFFRLAPKRSVINAIKHDVVSLTDDVNYETLERAHDKIRTALKIK